MEYPLIDTGMGDMPTAVPTMVPPTPKAPQPQDMQGVAFQLLAGMNPVLLGHAENVAKMANEKIRHGDILSHAARGIMPSERVQQIASVSSAPAPQVEDYDTPMIPSGGEGSFAPVSPREQLMSQLQELLYGRNDLALREADPTGMNQAFDNVAGIMGNAPTAPQMQRPRLSDTEQLGSLIAGALGGGFEGAAQAQNAAFQGAGIRANRENQIAQQNFEAENSQWINKLRTAQQIANNQANVFNQAENRNQRQFSNELRLQDGRIARTQQDIEDLDKQIQGFVDNTQKQVSEYTKLRGEMTDADMKHLLEVIDRQEKAQGLPKDYILERMMIAPVGWKSATVRNQERDDTFRDTKFVFDGNKFAQEFKLKQDALKQRGEQFKTTQDEKVREFNLKFNQSVTEFEKTYGRQVTNDEYRQAYQQGMMAIAGAREDRMASGGGSKEPIGGALAPGNVTPQGVTRWKTEFLKTFKEAAPEQFGPGSIKTSTHKEGKGLDLKFKDSKKNNPENLRPMFDYATAQRAPYVIYNGYQYKLDQKTNEYVVSKYNGPSSHRDHVHVDWHPWDKQGGKPSGMGIPLSESNAQGGNKSQRTQAQIDNPTQKPQPQVKPPGTPPNAGKGQPTNKTKSGDTFQFGKKPQR